jgi:hypothetical protein
VYATITGVPWQLIARQKNGVPDLINGVSAIDPTQVGGFKTAQELKQKDSHGNTFWDDIVGDPEAYVPPLSPFMQESTVPRHGIDPITGVDVSSNGNPITGHDWNIPMPAGDIEYACTFPLPTPRDCSVPGVDCDCTGNPNANNPLCAPNPNDNGNPTLQVGAKAYPGVRNLAIAKGLGDQGFVGSICPKQLVDSTQPDYGYRPAVRGILDRLQQRLAGQCLGHQLKTDAGGQVACAIIEASKSPTCNCAGAGRSPVTAAHQCVVDAAKMDPLYAVEKWSCFCEIDQTAGAALTDCQDNAAVQSTTNGWCYVDDSVSPPVGNPALVANCPASDRQLLRFVGAGAPSPGTTVFVSCQ